MSLGQHWKQIFYNIVVPNFICITTCVKQMFTFAFCLLYVASPKLLLPVALSVVA